MKHTIALLFATAIFAGAEPPKVSVATVDNDKLHSRLGYPILRRLEYPPEIQASFVDLQKRLRELEQKIIAAKNDDELQRATLEIALLKSKMTSLSSVAELRSANAEQKTELKALIRREFSDKYPVIFYQVGSGDPFQYAIHANIERVDITNEVIAAASKKLGLE